MIKRVGGDLRLTQNMPSSCAFVHLLSDSFRYLVRDNAVKMPGPGRMRQLSFLVRLWGR